MRLFLALWLAAFALQSADVFALVAPDGCAEFGQADGAGDGCPDESCATCICCARRPGPAARPLMLESEPPAIATPPVVITLFTSASPRPILHVPKIR
jgi:hypothetical protein